jgi:hypothetical protein
MLNLDLRRELKHLYSASARRVEIVDVPRFNFVMVDGQIEAGRTPSTSEGFQEALNAVYGISFTLKFASRMRVEDPVDYPVMPLEALWWTATGEIDFDRMDDWHYRLMILQPEHLNKPMFREAVVSLRLKRGDIPALGRLRFEPFAEGLCAQILHVGPYDLEPMTIARLKEFALGQGYRLRGRHHEIYLSDPRRAQPQKLRTILRQPIEKT